MTVSFILVVSIGLFFSKIVRFRTLEYINKMVVYSQMSEYLELNNLLQNNQHGFRPGCSTMTAWEDIQQEWAMKTKQGDVTGILVLDLLAAFDTLDCDLLCAKLEL